MKKISYALGLNIGHNLTGAGIKGLDINKFIDGIRDVLEKKPQAITTEEAQALLNSYFTNLQAEQAEEQMKAGKEYLAANAKKEGVVTLPSGLQYEILTEGNGAKPTASDNVVCHYHGTLIDGTIFDSSVRRGEPATFGVNQVIKGWVEALQLMSVGSKWRLTVPSELAYGAQGAGQHIAPYSTLIFEVELIDIA
jgi:FKBP-type peptidyl-prolyl cis-trans isomerase FklB